MDKTVSKVEEDYFAYNAMLNLLGDDQKIQFDKDRIAVRQFFLQHVNNNMVFFHNLKEKLEYLIDNQYYETEVIDLYTYEQIKTLFKSVYQHKFRFKTFQGAYKFYKQYALMTFDGKRYLERFEDRVSMTALYLGDGDIDLAMQYAREIITGVYQPATPTFLNAARKQRGEPVSCFLMNVTDDLDAIGRSVNSVLQLSKRGGGVAVCLTDIRETGAPIKGIEGVCSGIRPIMKIYEDAFSYANQLGARDGSGAVYIHACHPDIMLALDTKRENADEKIRIKTLSLGIVIPDILFELAANNEPLYLFSPYDVKRVYGIPLSEIHVTKMYREMVANKEIKKKKISALKLMETIATIQAESGYPYLMFEDVVNAANPIHGWVKMSNLCVHGETQILTKTGNRAIGPLAGSNQEIWNGHEWSEVEIVQTGTAQQLLEVHFNSTQSLKCTPYHRFLVIEQDRHGGRGKTVVKHAYQLKAGDKLDSFDLPVIEGELTLEKAYTNGFYTADGTEVWQPRSVQASSRVYLYGEKMKLQEFIEHDGPWLQSKEGTTVKRLIASNVSGLQAKYTVPGAQYTIESRIAWLEGLFDGDGTVAASSLQVGSIKVEFLHSVQLMLQTLGVQSKVCFAVKAGLRPLPKNDGTGQSKYYHCKEQWRLLIASSGVHQLQQLGFSTKRLVLPNVEHVNRNATRFNVVTALTLLEDTHNTYCFKEPKRQTGMFNGIKTMNCSEILQVQTDSEMNPDGSYKVVGKDVSCNLGSTNAVNLFESPDFGLSVELATRALTKVSDLSNIECVPSIDHGNKISHAIGLGMMNLHGFFGKYRMHYGSPESLDFTNLFFMAVNFHSIRTSCLIAQEKKETFLGFEQSKYADGSYFDLYVNGDWLPKTEQIHNMLEQQGFKLPTNRDWSELRSMVMEHGLYNQYRMAVPPTGSISYVNNATASIHPIAAKIEARKEGKTGRSYFPAPHMSNDNIEYYRDAYEIGPYKVIDVYAAATPHVDQGLSLTMFFPDNVTTRDINKAQIYARSKGIKTIYYIRLRKSLLAGTEVEGCVSCAV